MGLNIFNRNCSSCTPTSANAVAPNPNPGRFQILDVKQYGRNIVARIKYLDCTNFEGIKICVYRNMTCAQIYNMKAIDPHFSDQGTGPFARFEPSPEGQRAAVLFAKLLTEQG